MPDSDGAHRGGVLDQIERVSEVIFGVLMAMTFIGALNVAEAGRNEVRTAMVAALGCNIAWGLVAAPAPPRTSSKACVLCASEHTRTELKASAG